MTAGRQPDRLDAAQDCFEVLDILSGSLPVHNFQSKQFYIVTLNRNGNDCATVDCSRRWMAGN